MAVTKCTGENRRRKPKDNGKQEKTGKKTPMKTKVVYTLKPSGFKDSVLLSGNRYHFVSASHILRRDQSLQSIM